jgi:selenocysteine lyase/cysteine desulfurase
MVPAASLAMGQRDLPTPPTGEPRETASDETFWRAVAARYDVDRTIVNLENAYWGVMARPVEAAYVERTRFVNRVNVTYVRDAWPACRYYADLQAVRGRVPETLGCTSQELALTRSGTEALQDLIVNYNRLRAGDAVIYADLDLDAMHFAMEFLESRRGVTVTPALDVSTSARRDCATSIRIRPTRTGRPTISVRGY